MPYIIYLICCHTGSNIQWTLASKVRAHGKALTSLSTLGDIVVSGSSDSVVKVWEVTISG